nr:ribosomal protein S3 [Cylindrocapsa geminella]
MGFSPLFSQRHWDVLRLKNSKNYSLRHLVAPLLSNKKWNTKKMKWILFKSNDFSLSHLKNFLTVLKKLKNLRTILQKLAKKKIPLLRKEFFSKGKLPTAKVIYYNQLTNCMKNFKIVIRKLTLQYKLQKTLIKKQLLQRKIHINKIFNRKNTKSQKSLIILSRKYIRRNNTKEKFTKNAYSHSQNFVSNFYSEKYVLKAIKDQYQEGNFLKYLKTIIQNHRRENFYFYLSTIKYSRQQLKKLLWKLKEESLSWLGPDLDEKQISNKTLISKILENQRMIQEIDHQKGEIKKKFLKNRKTRKLKNKKKLKKFLTAKMKKKQRQLENSSTIEEIKSLDEKAQSFFLKLGTLKTVCTSFQHQKLLAPKISLRFYSLAVQPLKIKTTEKKQLFFLKASLAADAIVDDLEKRKRFRGVIKRVKENLMQFRGVQGVKIQVAGRLNGNEIARTEWVREGRVPLQTLQANIDYSYKTAKTIYGIIGVKVWIYKGNLKKTNK